MSRTRLMRKGFSLAESLMAVAIIALLLAILMPAVQAVRESARKAQCQNNIKQISLALHSYHELHGVLPPGTISRIASARDAFNILINSGGGFSATNASPETTWLFQILPQLDQSGAWSSFDSSTGSFGYINLQPPYLVSGLNANAKLLESTIPILKCPSDDPRPFHYDVNSLLGTSLGVPILFCDRGNYAANWGNTTWEQTTDLDGNGFADGSVTFYSAPFARSRSFQWSSFTDGLDHTIVTAEVRQGRGLDGRGAYAISIPGGSLYMSRFCPNGSIDRFNRIPSTGQGSGDQMPFPATCVSERGLPCTYDSRHFTSFAGSRSRHAGGVFVAYASGKVSFAPDNIDHIVWMALHGLSDGNQSQF